MALLYVTLTGTLGAGATGATATFTPAGWLADPTDGLLIPPETQQITLGTGGTFPASFELLATDNTNTPAGWTWMVTFSGIPTVAEYAFSFLLPHASGATQDISSLAQTPAVTPTQAYLPMPSGTPSSGQVPGWTGPGAGQTEWTSSGGGGGSGTVTSVSVATANGFAGTVANPTTTPALTLETSITGLLKGNGTAVSAATAGTDYLTPSGNGSSLTGLTQSQISGLTAALALLAPLASPALTGTPTAPTKSPLTDNTDIATTAYTDAAVAVETARAETAEALALPKAGGTMSGAIAMGSNKVTGLANGSATTDAAALGQVTQILAQTSSEITATTYTAVANQLVRCNTTSNAIAVSLPNAPASGTVVAVKITTLGAGNYVTVSCQGSDVFNKTGGSTSTNPYMLLGQGQIFAYQSGIWLVLADDLPLSQLETLFVQSVTAADTSVVVGGTATAPTVRTSTLDVIATDHPPAAAWSNNSFKITSLANGSAGTDAAAYGQTPAGGNTATVPQGGTGKTSLTAYALLAGGTTTTGNVQQVASVGSAGQLLYSAGASALPTFGSLLDLAVEPAGTLSRTIPVHIISSAAVAAVNTTGTVAITSIPLFAGMSVGHLQVLSGTTAASGPTHFWVAVLDSTLTVRAVSADQLTAAIAASTAYKLAVTIDGTNPYVVPSTGVYYFAVSTSASTTAPTLSGGGGQAATQGLTPTPYGTAGTQAAAPTVGAQLNGGTITAATSQNFAAWAMT